MEPMSHQQVIPVGRILRPDGWTSRGSGQAPGRMPRNNKKGNTPPHRKVGAGHHIPPSLRCLPEKQLMCWVILR